MLLCAIFKEIKALYMRMRRMKDLDEKIEEFGDLFIRVDYGNQNSSVVEEKDIHYFDYEAVFGNKNEVQLEIGCGKGQFICELAKRNPNINYFAIEKNPSVLAMACRDAVEAGINNVRFLNCSAEYLLRYFPKESVSRIYLNFSCPFPKHTYANRRLTHRKFLEIYKVIMKNDAEIHQKTDNMHFFEFSIEHFSANGFAIKNVSLDLHKSDFEGNIVTEYEQRFSEQGMPIYRLEAYLKK